MYKPRSKSAKSMAIKRIREKFFGPIGSGSSKRVISKSVLENSSLIANPIDVTKRNVSENLSSTFSESDESFEYDVNYISGTTDDNLEDEILCAGSTITSVGENIVDNESERVADFRSWAIEYDVDHSQLDRLLQLLRKHNFTGMPLSAKTLLKTPKKNSTSIITSTMISSEGYEGQYVHIGLEANLLKRMGNINCMNFKGGIIELIINIDGVPIDKSTSSQYWPILGAISDSTIRPFLIGIYYGDSKPKCVASYLDHFVKEANKLYEYGFEYNGECYKVHIKKICGDAPARAFIKCIKSHSGYFSCERCVQKGNFTNGKITYPSLECDLRCHDSYVEFNDKNHQLMKSPLLALKGIDFIYSIPLDYMHMACLGIMKNLLNRWIRERRSTFALKQSFITLISNKMENMSTLAPHEFTRIPRGFQNFEKWKATEFRFFMLYAGPVVLLESLSNRLYRNFMYLHYAMRIVCSDKLIIKYGEKAILYIKKFCLGLIQLYGEEMMVYNAHSIYHLVQDAVREQLSVHKYSCFPFESYLGQILKLVTAPVQPLQQIACRLDEIKYKTEIGDLGLNVHKNAEGLIEFINFKGYKIYPQRENDRYVLFQNQQVMKVDSIIEENKEHFCKGSLFNSSSTFYKKNVFDLHFLKIGDLSTYKFKVNINEMITKCIIIKQENISIAIGLLN